jgi:hypothetical protein
MTAEGLMLHVPNRTVVYRNYDVEAAVRINSLGFRGAEFAIPKPAGTYRILAVGDSYTEAMQVEERDTFVARLDAELATHGVEVLNVGVSGYGTGEELALLRAYGPRLEPDLVIVFFAVQNDARNNVQSPLCRRSGDGVECRDPERPSRSALASMQLRCWLASHSHLYQRLREATSDPFFARIGLRRPVLPDGTAEMPFGSDMYLAAEPAYLAEANAFTQEVLRDLLDWNRSIGAETWLVLIPSRDQIDDEEWSATSAKLPGAERDRPQRALASLGPALGIETIDLYPAFRRHAVTGERLYFRIDSHLNPTGHAVTTSELSARLLARRPWERRAAE